jgi:hypothetical protein
LHIWEDIIHLCPIVHIIQFKIFFQQYGNPGSVQSVTFHIAKFYLLEKQVFKIMEG